MSKQRNVLHLYPLIHYIIFSFLFSLFCLRIVERFLQDLEETKKLDQKSKKTFEDQEIEKFKIMSKKTSDKKSAQYPNMNEKVSSVVSVSASNEMAARKAANHVNVPIISGL